QLDTVEVGIHRARPGARVDVDHRRDLLGDAVARGVAGIAGSAVNGKDDGSVRRPDRVADRVDVIGQGNRGSGGVGRLEPGQRQRGDLVAVGPQRLGNLVPRPSTEPEPGDEDDRCGGIRRHPNLQKGESSCVRHVEHRPEFSTLVRYVKRWCYSRTMPETTVDVGALYAALDNKRRARGTSWPDIARELDVSPSTFSRMAQGRRPDVDTFATLLRWLGMPAESFMRGTTATPAAE